MKKIENIFCVGRNYRLHAEELKNEVPTTPIWFMKPTHSGVFTEARKEIALPENLGEIHYEIELVVQMKQDYHEALTIEDMIGAVCLGIDFTLRDLQSQLKAKGLPWLKAKGFKNSAVLSKSVDFTSLEDFSNWQFQLVKNQVTVQSGSPKEMIFTLPQLLKDCQDHFDLKTGDLIFTGTPAGVGKVTTGDYFQMILNEEILGEFSIK